MSLVEKISLMFISLQIPTAIHKHAAATMQYTGCLKKIVIELWSALARSL